MRPKLARLARTLEAEIDAHSLWRLRGLLDDCDAAAQHIADLDRRVERAFAEYQRPLNLLETIPGIRRTSAHAILEELGRGPAATFGSAHDLASWAGLCPWNNESAGKRRSGRVRRGNAALRVTLTECAHAAARTLNTQFPVSFRGCLMRCSGRVILRAGITYGIVAIQRPISRP